MTALDPSLCNLIQFVPQQSEEEHDKQKTRTRCASETDACGEDIKHFYEAIVSSDTTLNSEVESSKPVINEVKKKMKDKINSTSPEAKSSSLRTACNCDKTTRAGKKEGSICFKIHEHKSVAYLKASEQVSFSIRSQTAKLLQAAEMGDLEQVAELLGKGVDVNCQDYFGWTPLMVAAKQGNDQIVKYLLKHGSDLTIHSFDGHTAVTLARLSRHEHIVAAIVDFSPSDARDRIERPPSITSQESHYVHDKVEEGKSSGTYFCQICKCEVSFCEKSHETSVVHLFNSGHKLKNPSYLLPETNKGFDMLLKMGWQVNKGLGPHGDGPKYPLKTVLKLDRKGLGIDNCANKKAKITHFNPNDKSAIEHHSELPERKMTARKAARYASRAKEKRDRQRERHLRFEFSDHF